MRDQIMRAGDVTPEADDSFPAATSGESRAGTVTPISEELRDLAAALEYRDDTDAKTQASALRRAANSHDALLAALKEIQSQCAGHADEFSQRVWQKAEKAIALAKGRA